MLSQSVFVPHGLFAWSPPLHLLELQLASVVQRSPILPEEQELELQSMSRVQAESALPDVHMPAVHMLSLLQARPALPPPEHALEHAVAPGQSAMLLHVVPFLVPPMHILPDEQVPLLGEHTPSLRCVQTPSLTVEQSPPPWLQSESLLHELIIVLEGSCRQ